MSKPLYLELIIPIMTWNIIMFIFYFILLIIVCKNYSKQILPSQLRLELIIACILHQLSMTPLFTTDNDNSKFKIPCYIEVFLNIFSGFASLSFGLVIPNVVYRMIKSGELIELKKRKYHSIISLIIWGGLGIISFLFTWFSDSKIEDETICWYTENIICYIHPALSVLLCFIIIISFFHIRKGIKELIQESNEISSDSNYVSSLNKFFSFVIACLLLNVVNIIRNFLNDYTFLNVLLIIEDIVEIVFYPFIAALYSLNYDNWTTIKSILCCQKSPRESINENLLHRKSDNLSISPMLTE